MLPFYDEGLSDESSRLPGIAFFGLLDAEYAPIEQPQQPIIGADWPGFHGLGFIRHSLIRERILLLQNERMCPRIQFQQYLTLYELEDYYHCARGSPSWQDEQDRRSFLLDRMLCSGRVAAHGPNTRFDPGHRPEPRPRSMNRDEAG